MTNEEIKKILENHQHWLNEDIDGWKGMRADFSNADLFNADLRNTDLRHADLSNANLRHADLCGANLFNANLCNANLRGADLSGADLSNVNLICANLVGANLIGAKNVPFIPMACPDAGSFIGWKKAWNIDLTRDVLIKLFIPASARRSSSTGRKCRSDKAKVLSIEGVRCGEKYEYARSRHDSNFIYTVGEYVQIDDFDDDRFKECASGIHFFINKQEAINY